MDGIQLFALSLPLMFFLIAAGIQFIILTRLIRSQRLAIGVMKALGYNNRRIMWHYTSYGLAVSLVAAILGTGLGIGLAALLTNLFAQYFNLPNMTNEIHFQVVLYSFLITSLVGMASVFRFPLSYSYQPGGSNASPASFGRAAYYSGKLALVMEAVSSSWKMSLRSMFRNRGRFVVAFWEL